MTQFEQNFVQVDTSYWIMLTLVGKEAVQLDPLFRDLLAVKKEDGGLKMSFEFSEWTVQQTSSHDLQLVIIYRLQSDSDDRRIPMNIFFTEFSDYLETVVLRKEQLVLVAAFNIHVDVPYDS